MRSVCGYSADSQMKSISRPHGGCSGKTCRQEFLSRKLWTAKSFITRVNLRCGRRRSSVYALSIFFTWLQLLFSRLMHSVLLIASRRPWLSHKGFWCGQARMSFCGVRRRSVSTARCLRRSFGSILAGAKKVERNVGLIADNPTVVPGRSRRNVKQIAGPKFVNGAIFHRRRRATREDQTYMLDVATRFSHCRPNMK